MAGKKLMHPNIVRRLSTAAVRGVVMYSQLVRDGNTSPVSVFDATGTSTERINEQHPVSLAMSHDADVVINSTSSDISHTRNGLNITFDEIAPMASTITIESTVAASLVKADVIPLTGFSQFLGERVEMTVRHTSLSHATQQVDLQPSQSDRVYSTQDHDGGVYVRETNRRAPAANLTSLSPWNSFGNTRRAGVAITARHILVSNHFQIPVGSTIRFVGLDNTVYERTIANTTSIKSDLAAATLDSDLPSDITPALLPPANLASLFSETGREQSLIFYTDREEKILAGRVNLISEATVDINQSNIGDRDQYFEDWVGGDSGSPAFFIINDIPVVTHVAWTTAENGTSVHANLQAIDDYCALTGHTPTLADFTGFDSE